MLDIATADGAWLVDAIKAEIDQGNIETWIYDSDGDFTHSVPQWTNKAWLRPYVQRSSVQFGMITPTNGAITKEVYAIYHGRFIEMILAHFDTAVGKTSVSSGLQSPDKW